MFGKNGAEDLKWNVDRTAAVCYAFILKCLLQGYENLSYDVGWRVLGAASGDFSPDGLLSRLGIFGRL